MRYFIYLSYDGTNYHGWQIQPNGNSVQAELNRAVSILNGEPTEVTGAGRTDAGVNASMMVAHFDSTVLDNTECNQITHKLNRILPRDIAVSKVAAVTDDAHARFSATSRTYQYHIHTERNPFQNHYSYMPPFPLDFNAMNEAARHLFHYTDFTSFSKLHTDVKTNNCRIMKAEWEQTSETTWVFTIQADRFLRNMVRAIVGTLLDVGRGAISIEQFCRIIEQKDRCSAGTSVPGNALFLTVVDYPTHLFQ